mmetsp:Transcript_24890/g.82974  ORF Transcript_24890/g.82974 Transcript_24890/m.82974 type:complete len:253 (-) Transcript_24890:577-1335(-)
MPRARGRRSSIRTRAEAHSCFSATLLTCSNHDEVCLRISVRHQRRCRRRQWSRHQRRSSRQLQRRHSLHRGRCYDSRRRRRRRRRRRCCGLRRRCRGLLRWGRCRRRRRVDGCQLHGDHRGRGGQRGRCLLRGHRARWARPHRSVLWWRRDDSKACCRLCRCCLSRLTSWPSLAGASLERPAPSTERRGDAALVSRRTALHPGQCGNSLIAEVHVEGHQHCNCHPDWHIHKEDDAASSSETKRFVVPTRKIS